MGEPNVRNEIVCELPWYIHVRDQVDKCKTNGQTATCGKIVEGGNHSTAVLKHVVIRKHRFSELHKATGNLIKGLEACRSEFGVSGFVQTPLGSDGKEANGVRTRQEYEKLKRVLTKFLTNCQKESDEKEPPAWKNGEKPELARKRLLAWKVCIVAKIAEGLKLNDTHVNNLRRSLVQLAENKTEKGKDVVEIRDYADADSTVSVSLFLLRVSELYDAAMKLKDVLKRRANDLRKRAEEAARILGDEEIEKATGAIQRLEKLPNDIKGRDPKIKFRKEQRRPHEVGCQQCAILLGEIGVPPHLAKGKSV